MDANHDPQRDAFIQDPDDACAFEALEERYFLASDWEALVDLYAHRAAAPALAEDIDAIASLKFRMGQVLEERCLDPDRASEIYWQIAHETPGQHAPSLRQLRRIHSHRASGTSFSRSPSSRGGPTWRPTIARPFSPRWDVSGSTP